MKIVTRNGLDEPTVLTEDDRVLFAMDSGEIAYEVRMGRDGVSIEIRGVEDYRAADGRLFTGGLLVQPRVSNVIIVRSVEYDPVMPARKKE